MIEAIMTAMLGLLILSALVSFMGIIFLLHAIIVLKRLIRRK